MYMYMYVCAFRCGCMMICHLCSSINVNFKSLRGMLLSTIGLIEVNDPLASARVFTMLWPLIHFFRPTITCCGSENACHHVNITLLMLLSVFTSTFSPLPLPPQICDHSPPGHCPLLPLPLPPRPPPPPILGAAGGAEGREPCRGIVPSGRVPAPGRHPHDLPVP